MKLINRIFNTLQFDPLGPDTSVDLSELLDRLDVFQPFMALQGFGYAFQDEIGSLQENVA